MSTPARPIFVAVYTDETWAQSSEHGHATCGFNVCGDISPGDLVICWITKRGWVAVLEATSRPYDAPASEAIWGVDDSGSPLFPQRVRVRPAAILDTDVTVTNREVLAGSDVSMQSWGRSMSSGTAIRKHAALAQRVVDLIRARATDAAPETSPPTRAHTVAAARPARRSQAHQPADDAKAPTPLLAAISIPQCHTDLELGGPAGTPSTFEFHDTSLRVAIVEAAHLRQLDPTWEAARGVYVLIGDATADGRVRVYTGKAPKGLRRRIRTHRSTRDWWARALLVARATQQGFDSAEVGWLEGRLIELLAMSSGVAPENVKHDTDDSLRSHQVDILQQHVGRVLALLRLIGVPVTSFARER